MNTPIIDPMFFYWLQILDNLSIIAGIISFLGGSAIILFSCLAWVEHELGLNAAEYRDEYRAKCHYTRDAYISIIKKIALPLIIPILFLIFVPTKTTIIQMMLASKVTYENVQTSKKFVIDTIVEVKNALGENEK
jgi:hypothetical protein